MNDIKKMYQYIRTVELRNDKIEDFNRYPFCLPAIKSLEKLEFHEKVTFFVGENGSGKSTLLEAIAVAYGFNPEGGSQNFNFATENTHSNLCDYIRLTKGISKATEGYFLRAESFYNVASNIDKLDREGGGNRVIDSYGGVSLHEQSHGEAFWSTISNRFSARGIYILDEPEVALSPARQLALLSKIHALCNEGCQFIIATHSPILMSYPNAYVYEINEKIRRVNYKETEHFNLTKAFVNNPEKYLKILLSEEE